MHMSNVPGDVFEPKISIGTLLLSPLGVSTGVVRVVANRALQCLWLHTCVLSLCPFGIALVGFECIFQVLSCY